jgi:hypothetical protein
MGHSSQGATLCKTTGNSPATIQPAFLGCHVMLMWRMLIVCPCCTQKNKRSAARQSASNPTLLSVSACTVCDIYRHTQIYHIASLALSLTAENAVGAASCVKLTSANCMTIFSIFSSICDRECKRIYTVHKCRARWMAITMCNIDSTMPSPFTATPCACCTAETFVHVQVAVWQKCHFAGYGPVISLMTIL